MNERPNRASVLAFDVNETLLDLRGLDAPFQNVFGDASARVEWFQQLLQSAFVATITDAYCDFTSLGSAALDVVAVRRQQPLTNDDTQAILGSVRDLPPHPEVPAALERLVAAGFRLAALTNNTETVARAQMENANLMPLFERVLSADTVRRLKPAPEPYYMAATELGVSVGHLRLVAAHPWDIAGALRAGCRAAFVARPGMVLDASVPKPDIIGHDVADVADRLIEAKHAISL